MFRLEEPSFLDLVSHLRPYISPNPNSPNGRVLCADKKVAITWYYLKVCGTLSMTANSFGIATNTASAVINEVSNAIVLYAVTKYLHLPKKRKFQSLKPNSEWSRLMGVLMVSTYLLHARLNTLTIISVTNNSICLVYKLYAIIKLLLWMLNVNGLVMFTTQKYLQTLLFANVYVALTHLQYFKL